MSRCVQGYGWVPDAPDHRDRLFNLEEKVLRAVQLPRKVDLTEHMPPVYDQGQLGSCTANGIVAALVFDALKQGEQVQGLSNDDAGYSRLFVYYNERKIEGTVNQDSGAQIRDGIKSVASQGACPESMWPYDISRFTERPSSAAYNAGLNHKAIQYQRITPDGPGAPVHSALAQGYPVVFGFSVPNYFEDGTWDPTSQPLPIPTEDPDFQGYIGGHCVVIAGYDLDAKTLKIRNSWSTGWGQDGYFEMDQRWVDPYRGTSSDFWTIRSVS